MTARGLQRPKAQLIGRLAARRAEVRQAVRVMVGAGAAFTLYQALRLPQGYWAVFTVIIVMQGSIGGTLGASVDRLFGTVLGAAVGGLAATLRPDGSVALGAALVLSVGLTALAAAIRPNLKIAPVTAAIMLLSSAGGLSPPLAALYRVIEIALGGVVGVLATMLVWPARAHGVVAARAASGLERVGELLDGFAGSLEGGPIFDPHPAHARLRAALTAVETAMADAERERSSRLGDHSIPAAVPRTLWRVRNDTVSVGRAVASALPESLSGRLPSAAAAMLRAESELARRCGLALRSGKPVDRGDVETPHAAFETVFGTLRAEGRMRELDFETVGRVFSLAFALESLHRDLADLSDRVDEVASGAQVRSRPAPADLPSS